MLNYLETKSLRAFFTYKNLLILIFIQGILVSMNSAYAVLTQNISLINPQATAMGHAVTADPPGIDSIHFNPAGLNQFDEGIHYNIKTVFVYTDISAEFTATDEYLAALDFFNFTDPYANSTSEADGLAILLPTGDVVTMDEYAAGGISGIAYRPRDSKFTFGTSVYAPLIGGIHHDDGDPGVYSGQERTISRITYFSPTVSYEINDQWTIGAGLGFSYFGVALDMDLRFPNLILGGLGGISNTLCSGFEDSLLVSLQKAGIDFSQFCAGELSPVETLAEIDFVLEDKFSTTYNFGITWQPAKWLTFGFVYQSESSDYLEGDLTINYTEDLINYMNGFRSGVEDSAEVFGIAPLTDQILELLRYPESLEAEILPAYIDLSYPAHYALGTSIQLFPRWKVNFDIKYTETSNFGDLTIQFDEDSELLDFVNLLLGIVGTDNVDGVDDIAKDQIVLTRGWKDVFNWAIGVEYQATDQWTFMVGYEPRNSPIPDDRLDFIAPLADDVMYSFGATYQWSELTTISGAFAWLHAEADFPSGSSLNSNSVDLLNFIYNPYAGQDVSFETDVYLFELMYESRF